jgi:hypothetical protein
VRLSLDHHFPSAIAVQLRARGHDVETAEEGGVERMADDDLLRLVADRGRALLTTDVDDFTLIVRHWAVDGVRHSGVIFTADRSLSRSRRGIGSFVERLDALLAANPADDAFADRVHWL